MWAEISVGRLRGPIGLMWLAGTPSAARSRVIALPCVPLGRAPVGAGDLDEPRGGVLRRVRHETGMGSSGGAVAWPVIEDLLLGRSPDARTSRASCQPDHDVYRRGRRRVSFPIEALSGSVPGLVPRIPGPTQGTPRIPLPVAAAGRRANVRLPRRLVGLAHDPCQLRGVLALLQARARGQGQGLRHDPSVIARLQPIQLSAISSGSKGENCNNAARSCVSSEDAEFEVEDIEVLGGRVARPPVSPQDRRPMARRKRGGAHRRQERPPRRDLTIFLPGMRLEKKGRCRDGGGGATPPLDPLVEST